MGEREDDGETCAVGERSDGVGDALWCVRLQLAATRATECMTDARPEQAEVVIYLGGRADGGAR